MRALLAIKTLTTHYIDEEQSFQFYITNIVKDSIIEVAWI